MAQRKPIRVVLFGAGGRMGAALVPALAEAPQFEVTGAVVRKGDPRTGRGVADMPVLSYRTHWPDDGADVAIDFTGAGSFDSVLAECVQRRCPLVSGTTGLSAEQQGAMDEAARQIPVMWAANFSLGMALFRRLVAQASASLHDYDCEIIETHHRHKRDSPSGSALKLGETVVEARRAALAGMLSSRTTGPAGGDHAHAPIGMHSLRLGDTIGEHSVVFANSVERMELTHRATTRAVFAQGVLKAAEWISRKSPGSYQLDDVLG